MPVRQLPPEPSLEHLKNQAKSLQSRVRAGDPEALVLVREFHPELADVRAGDVRLAGFARAAAQRVIARRFGFPDWTELRKHVEARRRGGDGSGSGAAGSEVASHAERVDEFLRLACLDYSAADLRRHARAKELLAAHPTLATTNIWTMAAVGDVHAVEASLAINPELARAVGGPQGWEPILFVAYSRASKSEPGYSALEVARCLLAHGADANAGFLLHDLPSPFTALCGALGEGEDTRNQPAHPHAFALARLLLEAGADPNDTQALYNRHFSANDAHLRLLFEFGLGKGNGGPWHARLGAAHSTPQVMLEDQLTFAAAKGLLARVELLLAHGVNPDGVGSSHPVLGGLNALQLAQAAGHEDLVLLLLENGARPVDVDDVTAFVGACMCADQTRVDALRNMDPTLVQRSVERERVAIVHAATLGKLEAVRVLAGVGFDVNARVRETALHQAAWQGNLEMLALLLELGAKTTIRDTEFHATPYEWARHNGKNAAAQFLGERA